MTTKHNFTDAQMDGLTDEEREGLLDDTLVDDDDELEEHQQGAVQTATGKATESDDDGEGNGDDNGAGDDSGDAAANAAAAVAAAAAATPPADANAGLVIEHDANEIKLDDRRANWRDLDSLKEQRNGFNTKLKELAIKFDMGELTAEELHEQRAAIEAERDPIATQLMRAEIKMGDDTDRWKQETVPEFLKKNTMYGEKGSILNQMLDAEVRKIQMEAPNPTDPKILVLADQRIRAQLQLATGAAPANPQPKKPAKTPKPEIPPNLGGVPAAAATEPVDGSEYAVLDKLQVTDPSAFEETLGKLTAAQLNDYLSR